ncbi:MAG: DUF1501 domain-containing protein [Phycisphaerae bacterium]|jgi:hypothetical protein|nr:DUF1501 domain-containing protein [Phycisphaerae bacterium]
MEHGLGDERAVSRRAALKRGLLGAAGLALVQTHSAPSRAADGPSPARRGSTATRPALGRTAKARSVIQIWMWGGPSHLETFDPKPEAGQAYCGPLDKPVETNVKGIRICQLLPLLARQADKYALIRSMTHGVNAHETASYLVQTGQKPGRLVYPSVGAVVSLFKGVDHGYQGLVPPYVVLTELQGRFSEAGFLGPKYKPFATGGDPAKQPFAVEGIVAEGISDERQKRRRELLVGLDTLGRAMPTDANFQRFDACGEAAYEMMFGEARKLFDLSAEKEELRKRYGLNTFGQSCLMARRLVERGVPYVTINYKGWDTHKQHFQIMNRKLPELDAGLATLLQDLADRGLLESTIVWWGGEFGRTPRVQWEPPWNGGRGHWGNVFCSLVAGGGFKGGQVVGASDRKGEDVADRPVAPQDLIGSIYELLGIDPDGPLPNPRGMDVKVLEANLQGVRSGGRLREIM